MAGTERGRFAFLYRSEQGTIDATVWRRAALPLGAFFFILTVVWILVRPYASRGLTERSFIDAVSLAANIFGILYSFAVLLLAVCWVNLSAKRFRDRGRRPALGFAGLLPLVILADGALHWLQPQIADVLPGWSVYGGDAIVAALLAWTVAECLDLRRAPAAG